MFIGAFLGENILLAYLIPVSNNVADRFIFLSNVVTEMGYLVTEKDNYLFVLEVIGTEVNLQEWTELDMLV